jgi:glycosyltransferase involved in cell wall biosynthesis
MRIVYVTNRLPFGQGETFIIPEIEALLAAGHEVLIVPRRSNDPLVHDDARALVIHTRPVPGALTVAAAVVGAFVRDPRRTARAFRRLTRTRPRRRALVNTLATAEGMWLARAAREWGADHIHAHWAHATATLAMGASAVSGIPWSFTAHRYDIVLNNLLAEKLQSARFGRFISRTTLDLARQLAGPDAVAGAVVLHMGVPLPSASEDERPAHPTPVVLCPARLVPVKGHRHLLDAAARLAADGVGFEVWLAGDGPDAAALARQTRRLGIGDRVRMLGTVSHAELLRFYREGRVDCVVLPSVDLGGGVHEGISVALIEAMAHGVPVVSTRTGGLPELLEGGAGLLVPPADGDALAEALGRMLGSATLRAELGRAGRLRVAEQFDIAEIARDLARRFAGETASGHEPAPLASAMALGK